MEIYFIKKLSEKKFLSIYIRNLQIAVYKNIILSKLKMLSLKDLLAKNMNLLKLNKPQYITTNQTKVLVNYNFHRLLLKFKIVSAVKLVIHNLT